MGGGNRKNFNKSKSRRPPKSSSGRPLFVEGGVLADWSPSFSSPSSRGKNPNGGKSGSSRSGSGIGKHSSMSGSSSGYGSGSRSESMKNRGSAFAYVYPSFDSQEGSFPSRDGEGGNSLAESHPIVLVNSEETPIVAYIDDAPLKDMQSAECTYDYSTSFTLDESSHRGLGFCDEAEKAPECVGPSSKIEKTEGSSFESSTSDEEEPNDGNGFGSGTSAKSGDEFLAETSSPQQNPGFLSIGGLKIYTQDILDDGSDEEELLHEDSSDSSDSGDSTESSDTDGSSESGSDIDDEVAADYFEGIGGSGNIVNVDQLLGRIPSVSDDDSNSIDSFEETVEKLGGIKLQEASKEYGMMKAQSRIKSHMKDQKVTPSGYAWSSALDDLMLLKDPRTVSGRKKRVARIPQSWPSMAQKSKNAGRFPGEKKKYRKETIAQKRRARMIRHGIDLQQINLKLEQMVLDGVDIFSFQPMHSRDCSQIQRLAAIYRLRSVSQSSGKKRFVTVTRTQHTCMPSSSDRVRLEKLIGANDEDLNFTVYDMEPKKGDGNTAKKVLKGVNSSLQNLQSDLSKKKRNQKQVSYAAEPISFVSSGILRSDVVEVTATEPTDASDSCHDNKGVSGSIKHGAFELHTTGFGSKMMTKMGYVEGEGLGKDGQGIAEPIEVFQRPKSLGLGAEIPETSRKLAKMESRPGIASEISGTSGKLSRKEPQQFGAFEKHTKGFGSKMMAKMGFTEGMGLGRDSQGMVKPLVAVRRPRSRGLGAKG